MLAAGGPGRETGEATFSRPADAFREAFAKGHNLVCIMAAGIVVRSIAPSLKGKDTDPAVVVVDEAGRFAVSLLSGHLGGANELARRVATVLGGTAVITTATDVHGLPALDLLAVAEGLTIENLAGVRLIHMALLEGRTVRLVDSQGCFIRRIIGLSGVIQFRARSGPGPGRPRPHGVCGFPGTGLAPGVAQAAGPEPGGRNRAAIKKRLGKNCWRSYDTPSSRKSCPFCPGGVGHH